MGAWDIPPAWLTQLADDGVLVVPLRMNGITRSIAFGCEGDHLVSSSAEVCGFVPMQGIGRHDERMLVLTDDHGRQVRLRFDNGPPHHPQALDGVLATEPVEMWSGVAFPHQVYSADLHLWNACFLPGFCKVAADDGAELAVQRSSWVPFGAVRGGSFAYLAVRPAMDGAGVEFGARGYGGAAAAEAMVEQIQAWDQRARHAPAPTFGYWPAGSDHQALPPGAALLQKIHGVVAVCWPNPDKPA